MVASVRPRPSGWTTLCLHRPLLRPFLRFRRSSRLSSRPLVRRLRAVPAEVSKSLVPRLVPRLVPLHPSKEWNDPSGQQRTDIFDAPLCGRCDSLGAQFESTIVRQMVFKFRNKCILVRNEFRCFHIECDSRYFGVIHRN